MINHLFPKEYLLNIFLFAKISSLLTEELDRLSIAFCEYLVDNLLKSCLYTKEKESNTNDAQVNIEASIQLPTILYLSYIKHYSIITY